MSKAPQSLPVMMSVEAYARAEQERPLLHRLALGEREMRSRKGASLSRVFADADLLIKSR